MILETAETKREFRDRMKQELFPEGAVKTATIDNSFDWYSRIV